MPLTAAAFVAPPPGLRGAGRFAPTPTGRLHLGNARTALLAWLWARRTGRRNVLRVEDLDPRAIPPGCLEGQYADLDWLGLRYDEEPRTGGPAGPYRQSERAGLYRDALRALDDLGLLYPCWCSRKEVLAATRAPHAGDEGPVYPGTCRPATPGRLGDLDDLPLHHGKPPALRLDLDRAVALAPGGLDFDDEVRGPVRTDPATLGDFVVRRTDGIAAYQLACAFDDAAMGCDQVLRGADLVASGARQALVLRLLGAPLPRYAHVGLVLGHQGERLSKRDGSIAIEELRASGMPATEVVRRLAWLSGLPDTADLDELAAAFDLAAVGAHDVKL